MFVIFPYLRNNCIFGKISNTSSIKPDMLTGRKKEIAILNEMLQSRSSELIAVYGRRRVGKTFLIRETYKSNIVFEITGYYKASMRDQLRNFHTQLKAASSRFRKVKAPADWFAAFQMLEEYLDSKKSKNKKVVFIDEFPWIATARSKFLTAFEHFWNTYCTKRGDLVVIVCGSAASFMINKIIKNKGGLHNRLSSKIQLMPFNLNETREYLESKHVRFGHYDIIQLYMVIGGIPHYLNKVRKGQSIAQSIDRLCFEENGDLADEFNDVFASLFSNSKAHEKIVRVLSKSRKGITRKELLELCKFDSGGAYSRSLEELIESGFVSRYSPWGGMKRNSHYRLFDEYSLFYLKFIEPNRAMGTGTWLNLHTKQTFKSWSGFTFETICQKHIQQIKKELGIDRIYTTHSSWHSNNAQIDLLIDRDDRIINICEIKFYSDTFVINNQYYRDLKNKISQFRLNTGSRKNIFLTMITTFGVAENSYSNEVVTNSLTMDCLFQDTR